MDSRTGRSRCVDAEEKGEGKESMLREKDALREDHILHDRLYFMIEE